jgi:glycerophosphoryl diester phosphodiesterase
VSPRRSRPHPFLDEPSPIAIAHRGGAGDAPENTVEAFAAAVELGYRYLETDARVTADDFVVACHDEALDRTTGKCGVIPKLTIAAVEAADAGYDFPPGGPDYPFRGRGVRVPRLEALLRRWPEAKFIIDPKAWSSVEQLAAVIDRVDAWDRVCFGSFSDRRIARMRKLGRGRACTSMGPVATVVSMVTALVGRMPRMGADCVQVPIRMSKRGPTIVTERWVRAAHRAGLPVHVWTVDEPETMNRLLDLGVDGIMTDRPRVLRDVLAARPRAPEAQTVGL